LFSLFLMFCKLACVWSSLAKNGTIEFNRRYSQQENH
jgi:hypothetical protein